MDNNHCDYAGFSFTKQQLAAVLSTPEGRQLLTLLSRDGGSALSQAAQALKNGDAELAKSLVSPMLESSEAQALIAKINEQAGVNFPSNRPSAQCCRTRSRCRKSSRWRSLWAFLRPPRSKHLPRRPSRPFLIRLRQSRKLRRRTTGSRRLASFCKRRASSTAGRKIF